MWGEMKIHGQPKPTLRRVRLSKRIADSLSGLKYVQATNAGLALCTQQGVEIVVDACLPDNMSVREYSDGSIEIVEGGAH